MAVSADLLLPAYLLVLAGFLLFVNLKAGQTWLKFVTVAGMLAAVVGSAVVALAVYR